MPVRDRRTRAVRYKQIDADLPYNKQELDASVTVPNQIRLVLSTFRDKLFTDLFPGRTGQWVPKTLIFAKDDHHAEEQVAICDAVNRIESDIKGMLAAAGAPARTTNGLKQAVLRAAFSGTLVRQDSTDEPASTLLARIATESPALSPTRCPRRDV